ncbi:MAG TPA: penicillin-binding protein [Elusimicrobia bacterium]|jgi:cell division protein FtsI (penicillin-binding protein 3)|nr:penicillin-binding protein [Elusimicrobiota bacterium]
MFRQKRLFFCFSFLFLVFSLFIVRLFQIQLFRHKFFIQQVKKQYVCYERKESLRGMIFDRNGSNLVLSKEVDSCVAWPKQIKDKNRTIKGLTPILNLDESEIRSKFFSSRNFVWLKRKISSLEAEKIQKLGLQGVNLVKEGKRFYPEGNLLWHLLGKVNIDNEGIAGIELAYNDLLQGNAVNELKARDASGKKIDLVVPSPAVEQKKAGNLVLTIDKQIQHIAERELTKIYRETKAKKATLLVQDVNTGEILAWVCCPTYAEEEWKKNPLLLSNPGLNETIEPGSTFKVIPAAFALEENVTNPKEKYDCENGLFELHGIKIRDHEKRGILTFSEVLGYSSNIGMAKLGLRFNKQKFYQYVYNFGFGSPTGINLPGESPGIFDNQRTRFSASAVSLPIMCYGQGIGVTALQLVTAYSAIANGGLLMEPQVVKEVRDEKDKLLWQAQPVVIRRVLSEKTARLLQEMLEGVVEWGTGTNAKIKGYRIAGKTGTSQKFEPAIDKYSDTRHTASFCGFFPLPNPQWTILVILDEPQTGSYWGGTIAAPVFARVAEQMLNYFRILPESNKYAQVKKSP